MREEIAALLKSKRKNLGMSIKTVIEQLRTHGIEVSDKTLYSWESGYRQPDADTFVALCNIYGIESFSSIPHNKNTPSISDEAVRLAKDYDNLDNHGQRIVRIVTDEEKARMAVELKKQHSRESSNRKKTYFSVPEYLTPMSAGTGTEANQEYPENLRLIKEPPRGTSYIAHVSGDSMEPTYSDGDKLFIHACTNINVGQIGVFFMEGQQWVKELDNGVLISHNPEYEPIPLREDIRCQGLVLGICDESYFDH